MTSSLNWGLLSTARINRSLIPALKASRRNRLLAVASRDQATAEAYAQKWDIPRAWGNYQALLDDPQIDVVYISLPNGLHAEWSIRALRAGKHVLCEKPLALTLDEVDAMAAAARATGRVLAEALMYRHHPQTLKVKQLVEEGGLGELQLMRGSFSFRLERESYRSDPHQGGGSLWDVGCYPINYARLLAGAEPLEVFGWRLDGPTGVDQTFVGQLHFPGEVLAQFDCGFNSPPRSHLEIVCTRGILNIPVPYKPGLQESLFLTREGRMEQLKIAGQELYLGEVEDLADAVLLGRTPRVSLSDSRGNIAVIRALLDSARLGRPVSL